MGDLTLLVLALASVARFGMSFVRAPLRPPRAIPPLIARGSLLDLPNTSWNQAERHVVLRLATTCQSCAASATFYRRLSERIDSTAGARLTVVSSEQPEVIEPWLAGHGIRAHGVVFVADPSEMGFLLVPTVLFADSRGTVTDIHIGAMTPEDQTAVLARLAGLPRVVPFDNTRYAEELDARTLTSRVRGEEHIVLDMRDRAVFAQGHWPGALNIPDDELDVRGPVELESSKPLVVDCSGYSPVSCRVAARRLQLTRLGRVSILLGR